MHKKGIHSVYRLLDEAYDLKCFLFIFGLYFLAAELGLSLATLNDSVSPVWPATGVAIACLFVAGYRYALAIFFGAFLANSLTGTPWMANIGIALGNTGEAALIAWLLHAVSPYRNQQVMVKSLTYIVSATLGSMLSATVGCSSLLLTQILPAEIFGQVWVTWWAGDLLGALVVAPLLIEVFRTKFSCFRIGASRWLESTLVFSITIGLSVFIFSDINRASYLFLLFPLLLLTVIRLRAFDSMLLSLFIAAIAIVSTLQGDGPFQGGSLNDRLVFLQLFLASIAVSVLVLNELKLFGDIKYQAVIVLLIGWFLSGTLFYSFHESEIRKDKAHFDSLVSDATNFIRSEVEVYDDALRGGVGLYSASKWVDRSEWKAFADSIRIVQRHPGINGIGVIYSVPNSKLEEFEKMSAKDGVSDFKLTKVPGIDSADRPESDRSYIILYIEPLDQNRQALGLMISSEKNRFHAANLARDTGEPAITDQIQLVQDNRKRAGFLYLLPIYRNGAPLNTLEQRRKAHLGWVYSPIIGEDLITAALSPASKRELRYVVYDGDTLNKKSLIYSTIEGDDLSAFSIERTTHVKIGQRLFRFGWTRSEDFVSSHNTTAAWAAFIGSIMTLFLAGFVVSFQSIGVRARQIADEKTKALTQSESRFRSLVDSSPMGVILAQTDGKLLEVNDAFLDILGYTREDFTEGKLVREVFSPSEYREVDQAALQKLGQGLTVNPYEKEYIRKNGDRIPVLVGMSRVKEVSDQLTIFIVDLTDRKKMERELIEAKDSALAGVRARSQFLATMSHEIRTPLNGIIGMTDLLLGTSLDETQKKYAKITQQSGVNLLSIINDILDFSKIEAGKIHFEQVEFSPRQVLEGQVDIMAARLPSNKVSIQTHVDKDVPEKMIGDPGRLSQVLINLLGNALKFTLDGEIVVSVRLQDLSSDSVKLLFSVQDTGIGISSEKISSLFDPFSQADASTARKYGGTGLGLSICKKLVEQMNGEIWLESELGKGSNFYFTADFILSKHSKSFVEDEVEAPRESIHLQSFSIDDVEPELKDRKCRVLVAEDNSANQILALTYLRQLGFSAQAVANGIEAITAVKTGAYDIVLMDCQMPEMDGLEATRKIREMEQGSTNRIPIIALTANAMKDDKDICLAAGMDDYLSKPFKKSELSFILGRWMKLGSKTA